MKPTSDDLYALLIALYADQMGVEIKYELVDRKKDTQ